MPPLNRISAPALLFLGLLAGTFVLALVLAYWWGLAWFFVVVAARSIVFAVPKLVYTLLYVLGGGQAVDEFRRTQRPPSKPWLTSPAGAFQALMLVAVAAFLFWRANIPLKDLLSALDSPR